MDYDSTDSTQETVMDVVAEMRKEAVDRSADASCTMECAILRHYSDRIEAAAKRGDNPRRAALKPVLEVALSYEDGEPINRDDVEVCTDSEHAVSVNGKPIDDHTLAECLEAVREAQRIYNGGGESDVK